MLQRGGSESSALTGHAEKVNFLVLVLCFVFTRQNVNDSALMQAQKTGKTIDSCAYVCTCAYTCDEAVFMVKLQLLCLHALFCLRR